MTRSKLTNTEKSQILDLSQQPGTTVASLAAQFGVSTSTIRRILKNSAPAPVVATSPPPQAAASTNPDRPQKRSRKQITTPTRSQANPAGSPSNSSVTSTQTALFEEDPESGSSDLLEEDLVGFEDADLDLEEDFEDDDSDNLGETEVYASSSGQAGNLLKVMPLAGAALPRTCYLVVDRSAELITCPLKEFAELGQIPPEEVQEKTLPVFDNHRVARRFSNRMQRVIKLPDGSLLQKAVSQLHAKGITRLLVNGQVYAL